jgi:hypothetical protein
VASLDGYGDAIGKVADWRARWHAALAARGFRVLALATAPALVAAVAGFRWFLEFVESRSGVVLEDPVLPFVPRRDLAPLIFVVVYVTMIGGLVALVPHPRRLITGLWAYVFVLVARLGVMYLLPLDPPLTMVPLRDPVMELFGSHRTLTRDLFFSGHTATMCLFALVLPTRRLRALALLAMFVVAGGVLLQHAHYAVDVLAAPFFAYACYGLATRLVEKAAPTGDTA